MIIREQHLSEDILSHMRELCRFLADRYRSCCEMRESISYLYVAPKLTYLCNLAQTLIYDIDTHPDKDLDHLVFIHETLFVFIKYFVEQLTGLPLGPLENLSLRPLIHNNKPLQEAIDAFYHSEKNYPEQIARDLDEKLKEICLWGEDKEEEAAKKKFSPNIEAIFTTLIEETVKKENGKYKDLFKFFPQSRVKNSEEKPKLTPVQQTELKKVIHSSLSTFLSRNGFSQFSKQKFVPNYAINEIYTYQMACKIFNFLQNTSLSFEAQKAFTETCDPARFVKACENKSAPGRTITIHLEFDADKFYEQVRKAQARNTLSNKPR